ncbi:MAG: diguanylate cyclase [Phycisphaerae bacterium]|nr:diguanylate cyclase [Phycisphaerae bacterium]
MTAPALQPGEAKPVVLLVDDSQDVHRLLRARLRNEDLELVDAYTGGEAIEYARDHHPALVLLDLNMPGTDGFEVLRALKDDPTTLEIPVIVLSGLQSPHDKVTAFDLGVVDYITKPFELTELRVRIRSALRMHRLLQMLAKRARIDGLTGLWNRAYFNQRWEEEHGRHQRHSHPLTIALLDLDHFKSINDTYGHPAGDAVLQGLAAILQREARAADIACRYGGEEFALILPDTTPENAQVVCERIRAAVEAATWPRHPERRVTCSIGLVGAPGPTETCVASGGWLEAADRALYAAKKGGRNRVVSATAIGAEAALDAAA